MPREVNLFATDSNNMAYKSHRDYFRTKRDKLDIQNSLNTLSSLFSNYVFYFDGVHDILAIKSLSAQHGAKITDCYSRCTHCFAVNLTSRKIEIWNSKPVLKVDWIYDCIDKQKILPIYDYKVKKDLVGGQIGLQDFLKRANEEDLASGDQDQDSIEELSIASLNENTSEEAKDEHIESDTDEDYLIQFNDLMEEDVVIDEVPIQSVKNTKPVTPTKPKFVKQFYEKSRLHHLSTWKQDLVKFVLNFHQEISLQSSNSNRIIMHIDLDCFFASISIQKTDPLLSSRPVVVSHATNAQNPTSDISSCNYIAREFGIKNGSRYGSLLPKCSERQSKSALI